MEYTLFQIHSSKQENNSVNGVKLINYETNSIQQTIVSLFRSI